MEQELILFETAKLYKSKGFGLYWDNTKQYNFEKLQANGCDFDDWYDKNGELCYIKYPGDEGVSDYIDEDNVDTSYVAPPQSVLQRWLREIHGLHVEVYSHMNFGDECYEKEFEVFIHKEIFHDDVNIDGYFNTYEEALEAGLLNALKLI